MSPKCLSIHVEAKVMMCVCMHVHDICVCVRAHACTRMYSCVLKVNTGYLPQSLFTFIFETRSLTEPRAHRLACHQVLGLSLSLLPGAGLTAVYLGLVPLLWMCWGSELRPSYLLGKYFTTWTISRATMYLKFDKIQHFLKLFCRTMLGLWFLNQI